MNKVRITGTAGLRLGGKRRNKCFDARRRSKWHAVDIIPGQGVVLVALTDFVDIIK